MIRSFRSRALRAFYETGASSRLPVPNAARISRMLRALDDAGSPDQMNLPGYHFHVLRGARRWSIRATGNWRITFGWQGADAIDVDLEDYH